MAIKPIYSWTEVPVFFDLRIAARLLGQSYECVKRKAQRGELPAHKIGKEWRIDKDEFRQFVLSQ